MLFSFVRHGEGCHNFLRNIRDNIDKDNYRTLAYEINDPELTKSGLVISKFNGKSIREQIPAENITFVCCSPLLRSMETAYYMTRLWRDKPKKIYVVPYLREIDESTLKYGDKNSPSSRKIIDELGVYKMKSLDEQKEYLKEIKLLDYFDFTFVEKIENLPPKKKYFFFGDNEPLLSGRAARSEPGDISKFMKWAKKYMLPKFFENPEQKNINFFVVTHAGVLKDFAYQHKNFIIKNSDRVGEEIREQVPKDQIGFYNNGGFYLSDSSNENKKFELINFKGLYTKISDIEANTEVTKYNCTNNKNRCKNLCDNINKIN